MAGKSPVSSLANVREINETSFDNLPQDEDFLASGGVDDGGSGGSGGGAESRGGSGSGVGPGGKPYIQCLSKIKYERKRNDPVHFVRKLLLEQLP